MITDMKVLSALLSHLIRQAPVEVVSHIATRDMHILQFKTGGRQCIGVRVNEHSIVNLSDFSLTLPTDVCSALTADQHKLLSEATR